MQAISYLTGFTYMQVCMVGNIYVQGGLCVLAAMIPLFYIRHLNPSLRLVNIMNFCANALVIGAVFMHYHGMNLDDAGYLCVRDLKSIASVLGMTYIQLNVLIFIYLFCIDLFISRLLLELALKRGRRVMVCL